jgi:hypothetical protein
MLAKCRRNQQLRLLICCTFSVFNLSAQNVILLSKDITPEHDVLFTKAYIKEYGLKGVVTDILDKRDNELLKDYQKKKKFIYDSLGRCISILHTYPSIYGNIFTTARVKDGRVLKREQALAFDSTMYFCSYNASHQVTKTIQGNGLQFYNYYYTFDNSGHIKSVKKIYEVCKIFYEGICEPEHQKLLFEEFYTTTNFGNTQNKTIVNNDENRPFKEIIRNFNDNGQIVSEEERFLLSPFYTKYTWEYNVKGELVKKMYFKEEKEQWKMAFIYESNGKLSSEKIYKAGIFTNEIMYVYESSNGILGSYINRDEINKTMQIVKLNYILR